MQWSHALWIIRSSYLIRIMISIYILIIYDANQPWTEPVMNRTGPETKWSWTKPVLNRTGGQVALVVLEDIRKDINPFCLTGPHPTLFSRQRHGFWELQQTKSTKYIYIYIWLIRFERAWGGQVAVLVLDNIRKDINPFGLTELRKSQYWVRFEMLVKE